MLQAFKALCLAFGGACIMYGLIRYPAITLEKPNLLWLCFGTILIILGRPRITDWRLEFTMPIEERVASGHFFSTADHDAMIIQFLEENQKIEAIKFYQEITGMRLTDAKKYVDYLEHIHRGEH